MNSPRRVAEKQDAPRGIFGASYSGYSVKGTLIVTKDGAYGKAVLFVQLNRRDIGGGYLQGSALETLLLQDGEELGKDLTSDPLSDQILSHGDAVQIAVLVLHRHDIAPEDGAIVLWREPFKAHDALSGRSRTAEAKSAPGRRLV